MSLYEETRARLEDAMARLQVCTAQRPQPDPTALHRAQAAVQQQLQELRRAGLVTLAAKHAPARTDKPAAVAAAVTAEAVPAAISGPSQTTGKSSSKRAAAPAASATHTTSRFPPIHTSAAASASAAPTTTAAADASRSTRLPAARDGEQFRRGDLLGRPPGTGAPGASTATYHSAGKKTTSPSPQSRRAAKGTAASSQPLPSRLAASSPPPATTLAASSAHASPHLRALTPTPPTTAVRPSSSSAVLSGTVAGAATTAGGGAGTSTPAPTALVQLESTLLFVTTCTNEAAQAMEHGLRDEADAIFLKAIVGDVEGLRVIADAVVPAATAERCSEEPAPASAVSAGPARGPRRSPSATGRDATAGLLTSPTSNPDTDAAEHSWTNIFGKSSTGPGGSPSGFFVEVEDTARDRKRSEAYNFGVKGKHATMEELPLALRAYYAVLHYDMLVMVSAFHRLLGSDVYADRGPALLLQGASFVEQLVQRLCAVASAAPLRAGRDEVRPAHPSKPPLTRVGALPVKALLAVRETFNETQLRQLIGARVSYSEEDVQSIHVDYKVGECGYHLVFAGTVYIYEMVQFLLRRAQMLERHIDRSSSSSSGGGGGLEAAAVAGASLSHTAVSEEQWVQSMVTALTGDEDDDSDPRRGPAPSLTAATSSPSQQFSQLFVVCTTALAQCVDICEGVSALFFKLASTKYLGWRVKLYDALAQAYESRGQYPEALAIVKRMSRKTKELVALEFYDPVPPPAEWQATLEAALQYCGLAEMKYAWYAFITAQQSFVAERAAATLASTSASAASAASAGATLADLNATDGGAAAAGQERTRRGSGSRVASSDPRHRSGTTSGAAAAAGGGASADACPVVVSESGAVLSEESLPRTGAALLAEMWNSLSRHPLPQPGSKAALDDEAGKVGSASLPGSPVKVASSTKSKRKSSLASVTGGGAVSAASSQPQQLLAQVQRKELTARHDEQVRRGCLRQFASQSLTFLSGLLVKQPTRVEALERDIADLFTDGFSLAGVRGKSAPRGSSASSPNRTGASVVRLSDQTEASTSASASAGPSPPPIVSFANLRRCAREALEIIFHSLSAQAVALPDAYLRGALLTPSSNSNSSVDSFFPFAYQEAFSLMKENAAVGEAVGVTLRAAVEEAKAAKLESESAAAAAAASANTGGAGKGHKKQKAKSTAVTGGASSGANSKGGAAGTALSSSSAAGGGNAGSGGGKGGGGGSVGSCTAEGLVEDAAFITALSIPSLFPRLTALAKWDRLACMEQLRAAATESPSDTGDMPTLRLPKGKATTPTQSPLGLPMESSLERELVTLLRVYVGLFSTACHAMYIRSGAVLRHLVGTCRTAVAKQLQAQQRQGGVGAGSEGSGGSASPSLQRLLETTETTLRMLQQLHLSVLVSRFAAESCCHVEDVLLVGQSDLRLVGLPRWLAEYRERVDGDLETAASSVNVGEQVTAIVSGPGALLAGLMLSVKRFVAHQAENATRHASVFHPAAPTATTSASSSPRVYPLCTPLLAPAELLRQLSGAVMGSALTAAWPRVPLLASTTDLTYACAALLEQTLFTTADLILHEATVIVSARREARQHREQLGLTVTPFIDPTPSFVRPLPLLVSQPSSPAQTEEEVDEAQERTYFQVVVRTVEAMAGTGAVDPVRLARLAHSLADTALHDVETTQRMTSEPEPSTCGTAEGEKGSTRVLQTLERQKATTRGKTLSAATTMTFNDDLSLPSYPRERRLQDLLERVRLAHAFVTIAGQLIIRRADALEQVAASAPSSSPVPHFTQLRHALEDANTDLSRTAAQLRWYVALLRSQTAAYAQRQEDIQTLLARQLHSDVYGVVTAKETRILTALLDDEPELPQTAEAEEARQISAAYRDPLKSATVMLALATVVPKPLSAQRELLGKAVDVLLKAERATTTMAVATSGGDDTADETAERRAGAVRAKGKSKKDVRDKSSTRSELFSRLMVWGYAASTSAKLGVTTLANTAAAVLYRHYVFASADLSEDASSSSSSQTPQRPMEEVLRSYRLVPRFEALTSCSDGAVTTLCHALLDLSAMELTAVRDDPVPQATRRAGPQPRDAQQVGLRSAYRLLFALQLLSMRQAGSSSSSNGGARGASAGLQSSAENVSGGTGTNGKSSSARAAGGKSATSPARPKSDNTAGTSAASSSSSSSDDVLVSMAPTDPLSLHCANELLNALLLVLEDDAFCPYAIPPLVALCHTIIGIRAPLVWCEVDVQLFAIRTLKALRDTLVRLLSQQAPPASHTLSPATATNSPDGLHGFKIEELKLLLHRTFAHAWNAVYANPNGRQQRFLANVAAESVHARQVLSTKDGIPLPPPSANPTAEDARGGKGRGGGGGGLGPAKPTDGASASPDAEDVGAAVGGAAANADGVFTFAGSQYAPEPSSAFIYDTMPIEYLELLEQLLLSQCTPEAVQDLLHPRPVPAPPRLAPLPRPTSPSTLRGDDGVGGHAGSAEARSSSASSSQRASMQSGGKKGAPRRVSAHNTAAGQSQRRPRGPSVRSSASLTEEEAAAVASTHTAHQREQAAAERRALAAQLRERLRIQASYAVAHRLGDAPLRGLPEVLTQLAEALARDASVAALVAHNSTAAASPSATSAASALDVLERFAHDPLQTRLAVGVVMFYLTHGDSLTARAAASVALSNVMEQWSGMKAFVDNVQIGLRQWQIQHGFILSERAQYTGPDGHSGDDGETDGGDGLEDDAEGGEKMQPGGQRGKSLDGSKNKSKAAAAGAAKRKAQNATAAKKKGSGSTKKGGGGGGAAGAEDDDAENADDGPDSRFLDLPRVWTPAEQLMLKQVTRSLTWLRRRRVFTWLTRRFFQFNGPAQAQLRMYTAIMMRMEKDHSEEAKGSGGILASLPCHVRSVMAARDKDGLSGLADSSNGGGGGSGASASPRSMSPVPGASAGGNTSGNSTSKGKRALQQQQAESEAAMAQRARDELDKLELRLAENGLRAAKLFNQAFLPARSARAVQLVVDHLRQHVCEQLPDGFLLSATDPFLEASTSAAGSPYARRRSDVFDDDQLSERTLSVWGGPGASGGGPGALAAIDVVSFLPSATVEKLRALAPCLLELAKELLCAMATVALGYCDHRRDLELSQPSAVKTGQYVRLPQQIRFQGVIPSLYVCASPAGQFEEHRHVLLTQMAHTRHAKQIQRRVKECAEMEQTTRAMLVEAWKSELIAKVDGKADVEAEAGHDDDAAVWFDFSRKLRVEIASWDPLDMLSPTSRARRVQQMHVSPRGPPRMFMLDTTAISGGGGAGEDGAAGHAEEGAGARGPSGRRRAGPPTSTLVYFPFETPLLRRQLWTDTRNATQQQPEDEPEANPAAASVYALRLGNDMPEALLVESVIYLARAVQLTRQKEAVQLCLAANALTRGRYATALLPLAMTVQAAIGVPSTPELLRAYQLARAETPVGVALVEVARRSWQRYQFTEAYQKARQRLARSLQPSLKHFEDPTGMATTFASNAGPTTTFLQSHGSFDGRVAASGVGGGASSLKVSLKAVVSQYETALAALRKNRDFGLVGECLSEMGELYLVHRNRTEAETCWRDAVDALLETPRSLQTWRTSPCDVAHLTITRVLLAVSALSSLAMYAFRDQQRKAVEACVLAASLVDRLLTEAGVSLMLPERAFDYAAYTIAGLHRALRYLDLALRQHDQIHRIVHHLLHVAHTLLEFDYAVHASLVATFAEYLAARFAKHWVMVVEARLIRARAAAKAGHFTAAFNALRAVCLGESLPEVAVAFAPLSAVRDSLVASQHFIRCTRGGGGAASGGGGSSAASDGKKSSRQQSNAGGAGGGAAASSGGSGGAGPGAGALSGAAASAPGPVDGHAHPSVLDAFADLQYRNDEVPSSAANVDYVGWFVAACLPNFSTLFPTAASASASATPTSTAGGGGGHSSASLPNVAQCLDANVVDLLGPLIAPRVVLAVAEVLVSLGGREGVYQWGEGVVGDLSAVTGRPTSARTAGRAGTSGAGRQRMGSVAGATAGATGAVASAAAGASPGAASAATTTTASVVVESGPAVVLRCPTACTVALQLAEPLLDSLRQDHISLSPVALGNANGSIAQPSSSRGGPGAGGGLHRTPSSSSGLSGRGMASHAAAAAGPATSGADQEGRLVSPQRLAQLVQQQRVEQAAMLRQHATHLRAVALAARGRLRQAVALLEAHLNEFNELAVPTVEAGRGRAAGGAATVMTVTTTATGAARESSLGRHQSFKGSRVAADAATFQLLGKGFDVSSVMCTPSYLLTVSHTHWCRVYALLTASYFGLRRFQAMESASRHALTLCDQCEDPYSSRLFLLYRCAALAQRGRLEEASETAQQLQAITAALSFAPRGFVSLAGPGAGDGGDGGGHEQLAEQMCRLAVPCAHGMAAADAWDASTLLVQNWLQQALAQQSAQQQQQRGLALTTSSAAKGSGEGAGSSQKRTRSAQKKKASRRGNNSSSSDSDDDAAESAKAEGGADGSGEKASVLLSRAVCALAANAFFQGVAPWAPPEPTAIQQSLPSCLKNSNNNNKKSKRSPCTMSRTHWVVSPYAPTLAWNSDSLTQLHRAMNVYAASFISPAASRGEVGRAVRVLLQALEGVAPQYDTRAHPTSLVNTKLLLARASLRLVDWNNLTYSAPPPPPTASTPGTLPVSAATPAVAKGRKTSLRRPSSTSGATASAASEAAAVAAAAAGAQRHSPLLFRHPSQAIAALPYPSTTTAGADAFALPNTALKARGHLQCAAALLLETVQESVTAAVHDYGLLQLALLELAGVFARVSATAQHAARLEDKRASSVPSSADKPTAVPAHDNSNDGSEHRDGTHEGKSRYLRELAKACGPIAASCTLLAMLLHEMHANVFDRTRAFVDYTTDESAMVMPIATLERVLPERVVATVEAAARQLGTLRGDLESSATAGAGGASVRTIPIDSFYQPAAPDTGSGRLRGAGDATGASAGGNRRAGGAHQNGAAVGGTTLAMGDAVPLPQIVHAFATLHREYGLAALMPAPEALDREAALLVLRAFLQTKTAPPSCVYLCYSEAARHAHAVALAGSGSSSSGSSSASPLVGIGFSGGASIGNARRGGGAGGGGASAVNMAAQQQQQEALDVWNALLPPILLSGSVDGYMTSAGPQLLGAPSVNSVVAACFQSTSGPDPLRSRALTQSHDAKGWMTLLLVVAPLHDDQLSHAPPLSTPADRKRLLRGYPTCLQAADSAQAGAMGSSDRSPAGRSGRAGSAHSSDGFNARRRASSRQGMLASAGRLGGGGGLNTAGLAGDGAAVSVGDGRTHPLMMDALLAERIDALSTAAAADDVDKAARAPNANASLVPSSSSPGPHNSPRTSETDATAEQARIGAASAWSSLSVELPVDEVCQLHAQARSVLQLQARLLECQRRAANQKSGSASDAVSGAGVAPEAGTVLTRKASVSRPGGGAAGGGGALSQATVIAPSQLDPLASGATQLHSALLEATSALKSKASLQGAAGVTGVGLGGGAGSGGAGSQTAGGVSGGASSAAGGAAQGGGGGGPRHTTTAARRSPSSLNTPADGSGANSAAGSFGASGGHNNDGVVEARVHDLARAEAKQREAALQAELADVTEALDEAKSAFVMGLVEALVRTHVARALADEALMEACVAQLLPECAVTPALFAFFVQWFSAASRGAGTGSQSVSTSGLSTASCFFEPGLHEWMGRVVSCVTQWREDALQDV